LRRRDAVRASADLTTEHLAEVGSCAGRDHAGVLLEHTVLRWPADLTGFPHRPGGGLLTSMARADLPASDPHKAG
jgi:hypothetical protein